MIQEDIQLADAAALQRRHEDERRLTTIVKDLWHHSERLVKAEVELGITEVQRHVEEGVDKAKVALRHAAIIGGLFYAAYLTLLAALVMGLSTVMPTWVAALIVGVLSGGAGYLLVERDKRAVKEAVKEPVQRHLPHNIAQQH